MGIALAEFADKLVPVSDFSQGKAGKIFKDVFENNKEYIVLRNNQPTAVVMSINEYKETQEKAEKLERLLDTIESFRLLSIAEKRKESKTEDFLSFLESEGMSASELEAMADSVEVE